MNVFLTRLVIVFMLLTSLVQLDAQKVTFDNVVKAKLTSSGPITESGQVKGYFFFYEIDKVDRKNRAYMLEILDENMVKVGKKKLIKPKTTLLTEAAYNGEVFLFSFVDPKKKTLNLVTYDKTMARKGSRKYELDKWGMSQLYTGSAVSSDPSFNKIIYPVGNRGFMRYTAKKNKKLGYDLEYLSNDLKKANSWNHSSDPTSKELQFASFGDISEKYLVSSIMKKPKLLGAKNLSFHLSVVDLTTEKELFNKPMENSKYLFSYMNSFINEDKGTFLVFGEYFQQGDNIMKDKSTGLFSMEYDIAGNVTQEVYYDWKKDISKMIKVDKKGKIGDGGHVAFHRIVQTSDGHFYAIGEMYRKAVSGFGIASQVLGGGGRGAAAAAKMVVMDMVAFEFDADLALKDVSVIEKRESDVLLPAGMGFYPPSMLAMYIRTLGLFDYNYTQTTLDKSSFFATYTAITDAKKRKDREVYFGIISRTEGDDEYVLDRVDLTSDATTIRVYPAKTGYILLTEYFKKEKKIENRLEKINY